MPPRHAYWTILIDDQPTAFRAHDPEELLPTLNRLREKNESAVMKWFERGQLFDSRDAAREAGLGRGERRWEGPRPAREGREGDSSSRESGEGRRYPDDRGRSSGDRPRDKSWRPGGEHRDPRQKYKDAKKAKWNRFKEKIRERHEARMERDPESFSPPHGDPFRDQLENRRPRAPRPRDEDRDGAPSRPHGDRFRDRPTRTDARFEKDAERAPRKPRPEWRSREEDRGGSGYRDRKQPGGRFDNRADRQRDEWRSRPQRPPREDFRDRERQDWRDTERPPRRDDDRARPAGKKPFGKKPFGKKPFGTKPFGTKPFGKKPSGKKPFGKKPFGNKTFAAGSGGRNPRPGSFRNSKPPRRRRDDED
jgi:23S rRNA pseudouridine2605 synthase